MPVEKLIEYLDSHDVKYTVIEHDTAYTAQEAAAAAHVPGDQLAKAVMIYLNGEMAMAVLPASLRVNLERLKEHAGAKKASIATEKQFKDQFPDCDVGALPPFGNLYGLKVYADESLAQETDIAICGGTHTDLVRIRYEDFQRLAEPEICEFAYQPE